jgi:hypothetical protein
MVRQRNNSSSPLLMLLPQHVSAIRPSRHEKMKTSPEMFFFVHDDRNFFFVKLKSKNSDCFRVFGESRNGKYTYFIFVAVL